MPRRGLAKNKRSSFFVSVSHGVCLFYLFLPWWFWLFIYSFLLFISGSQRSSSHLSIWCLRALLALWPGLSIMHPSPFLIRETTAWISECWQADLEGQSGHAFPSAASLNTVLCVDGVAGTQITLPAEAGSENWRCSCYQTFVSSLSYMEPKWNHVCFHHVDLCMQLDSQWVKRCSPPKTETFSPPIPLLFKSPFSVTIRSFGEG